MAYADAANYNTIRSMKGYPIGSIVPWSGAIDNIPVGWVVCSGSTPPISRYPLLYEVLGNTYGGTPGATFRLPNLTDGSSAVMDIYQGHFQYLQNAGEAHAPENTSRSADTFWNLVGQADNGNRPGNTQTNWTSTIDIVGEHESRPNMVARHEDFALSEGDYSLTISVNERKLSDRHVPSHIHSWESDGSPSYDRRSNRATLNSDRFFEDAVCYLNGSRTTVSRSTNDPPVTGRDMATVGTSRQISTNFRAGGGNIINDQPSWDGQNRATGFNSGDGLSGGDMWAHRGGQRYFWSSLSHAETTFAQITGHTHGSLEYNWESRIRVLNPGTVTDVSSNGVNIDNSAGVNFGTINMNSATPTLSMLFIIKAY